MYNPLDSLTVFDFAANISKYCTAAVNYLQGIVVGIDYRSVSKPLCSYGQQSLQNARALDGDAFASLSSDVFWFVLTINAREDHFDDVEADRVKELVLLSFSYGLDFFTFQYSL